MNITYQKQTIAIGSGVKVGVMGFGNGAVCLSTYTSGCTMQIHMDAADARTLADQISECLALKYQRTEPTPPEPAYADARNPEYWERHE
jgi:hypothetical protein